MVCKHFNIPWTYLRDDISITDYLALLVTSMEAEENERYVEGVITSIAFNNPKGLKKLKPKHKRISHKNPADSLAAFALMATRGNLASSKGSPHELAGWTGRAVVYLGDDGLLRDVDGQVVAKDPTRQVVIRGNPN